MKSSPSLVGILLAIVIAISGSVFLYRYASEMSGRTASGATQRPTTGAYRDTLSPTNPELYAKTFVPTYGTGSLDAFRKELSTLDAEVATGKALVESRDAQLKTILRRAELHEALGQTGEAIRILEENYQNNVDQSSEYNNMMATLYEKVGAYDLALAHYDVLVREMGDFTYLQRVAEVWRKKGDEAKAKKALDTYAILLKKQEDEERARMSETSVVTSSGATGATVTGSGR